MVRDIIVSFINNRHKCLGLIAGDVNGKLDALYKRVKSVMKKGNFEMLLCVGEFFNSENEAEFMPYLLGDKRVCLQTYILGPLKEENRKYFTDPNGCDLCINLTYLGNSGMYKMGSSLQIAYMNTASNTLGKDITSLLNASDASYSHFRGIDILLTSHWPTGVQKFANKSPETEVEIDDKIGEKVAQAAYMLRPRYHFSARRLVYYERLPYRNHVVLQEQTKHVTRFFGLADVANPAKHKWMYAFSIVPFVTMNTEELRVQPDVVTERPYLHNLRLLTDDGKRNATSDQPESFFYKNEQKRPRINKPKPDKGTCWFCLGFEKTEKHLVISVGTHVYAVLPKGGVSEHHVLIVPIHHHKSVREIEDKEILDEINEYKNILKAIYKSKNMKLIFFERNFITMHLQINAIAVDNSIEDEVIEEAFNNIALANGLEIIDMQGAGLEKYKVSGEVYFHAILPNDKQYLINIKPKGFPIHFGRMVLASPKILNDSNKINWKDCVLDRKDEDLIVSKFRHQWKANSS